MKNKTPVELIDIEKEAQSVESLFNESFKHTLSESVISSLIKNINSIFNEKYGNLFINGNKGNVSTVIYDRLDKLVEIYKSNPMNYFEDREYSFLKSFIPKSRSFAIHLDYDRILKHVKKELKEEIKCLKTLKLKEQDPNYKYDGFDSGAATHPGLHVSLEKEYSEYRLERYGEKLETHILESVLTHIIEITMANNEIKFIQQLTAYFNSQERDEKTGLIIKEDLSLLKEPFFKFVLEVSQNKDVEIDALIDDYIKKNGIFKVEEKEIKECRKPRI